MKLVRYGRPGQEKPGLIDADGALRDLSRVVKDITPEVLAPGGLTRLRGAKVARLPVVRGRPRLGVPLAGIGKMVCIGLNYTDHAAEVSMALPTEPTLFIKAPSALCGPNDATVRPRGGVKLDYEVELAAVIAREEERLRISREIHDDLGELLTGFKLGLAWIRDKLQTEPRGDVQEQVLEKIAILGTLADTTTGLVRKLCSELRPSVLDDLGLVAAIEWQTREFQKRTNIRCELNLDEQQLVVSSDQGIALFRIYQEILTNVARHSQASKVRVLLRADAASLFLEVKDNGRGIQPAQIAGTGSLGLLGMRERAAVLGGKLDIHGEKARGTTITVAIPVTRTAGTESPREAH